MRSLKIGLAALLTAVCAQTAGAQRIPLKFLSGGTVTAYGYYVGPYTGGTGPGYTKPVVLNCVDYFHHITVGQLWTANVTNVGSANLSKTRFGSTFANASTLYWQAAYLTTLFQGKTNAQIGQIQATIWRLFDSNLAVSPTPPNPGTNLWLTMAQNNYQTIDPRSFVILTDVNRSNPNGTDNVNSAQEFISFATTPEPASMILLGTGLIGLAAAARRRSRARPENRGGQG